MQNHQIDYPTTVQFGWGIRRRLPSVLAGCKRPLLIVDDRVPDLHWWPELLKMIKNFDFEIYADVVGNPKTSHVEEGRRLAREHKSDAIVSIGGGAATDVAKAVALLAHHPGKLFDYAIGERKVSKELPRLVALPTTAGSGNEMGRKAVITDDKTRVTRAVESPMLLPVEVLADPELTMTMPACVTAATGMDALTHLVEAFIAKGSNPAYEKIALQGVDLVARSLITAVGAAREESSDTEEHRQARTDMLYASLMGAVALQKGLGATHACAYALSSVSHLHHGLANGVMLPYVMAFNAPSVEEKFGHLAKAVGMNSGSAEGFVRWLDWLNTEVGIPRRLAMVGVEQEEVKDLVTVAFDEPCRRCNPRPIGRRDLGKLFREAIG